MKISIYLIASINLYLLVFPNSFSIAKSERNMKVNENSERTHPLTHENQLITTLSDSENGDNVGKGYELGTDSRLAPTVRIKSSMDKDQIFQGDNILVKAVAGDTDGTIAKTEFYGANTLRGTDTTLPHRFYWSDLPAGSFALTAKATDDNGNKTVSEKVHITVAEKAIAAPTVRIKNPQNNDQFTRGENIIVKAVAEDTDGTIAKVEFYIDNTLMRTDTTFPHRLYWSDLPVGSFALTAKATDDKGNTTVSETVHINVAEIDEHVYGFGEKIIVTAEPNSGYKFLNWTSDGEEVSKERTYEFIMPAKNVVIKANFEEESSKNSRTVFEDMDENSFKGVVDSLETQLITREHLLLKGKKSDNSDILLRYVISPNPAHDFLNITFHNLDGNYEFEIRTVSMGGITQNIYKALAGDSDITIDIKDLNPGIYLLELIFNGRTISRDKFIKK